MVMAPRRVSSPPRWTRSSAVLGSLLLAAIFSKKTTSNWQADASTTPNADFSVLSLATLSSFTSLTGTDHVLGEAGNSISQTLKGKEIDKVLDSAHIPP
ncbi:hypothetical protein PR003_g27029 [Phytophthora rubi]|uniref:RxLR effector protein n=1 Tax=Phytophthora rubi TaxID=129364 RepID=A0A6A4CAL6_9STRA|nr:hypothetical protein PR002_g17372 [Phytophthora rubi]KAE9026594.1 hypothetical protein PR001_g12166 [Phytophthora rubi]KAE9283785.1 hypothetical protein PR003_g27029 [Phytophthora rubi]